MIRGQKRTKTPKVEAKLNCSIHNRFDFEVVDAKTGKVKQRAQAENIILNALWTRLLAPNTYFNYIFYGTGSGTPAATDTALFMHLGYKAATNATYDCHWDEGYVSLRKQCQISEAEHAGSTLSEVGIGWGTSASNLVTHALLKDMNGNPITIAKTATDIINIYATVFLHWDTAGYDGGSVNIVNNQFNEFIRYLLGGSTNAALSYTVALPGGLMNRLPPMYANTSNSVSYNSTNKTITVAMTRLPVASGNIDGIGLIVLGFNMYLDASGITAKVGGSWYPGSSIIGESIGTGNGVTQDFATDFPFVQSGAKIYVNSVEQTSGVTVDVNTPLMYNNMGYYFECLPQYAIGDGPRPVMPLTSVGASTTIYYNTRYADGIVSFYATGLEVSVSDDLENWTPITSPVDIAYQHSKYWKFVNPSNGPRRLNDFTTDAFTAYNIHFDTPPAPGAVITADYTTKTIAKDENHVFDFSLVITLGEHTV